MGRFNELEILLQKLREIRRRVSKELSRAPNGNLYITEDRGYKVYRQLTYDKGIKKQISIGKNPRLVASLAHKAYDLEKLKRIDANIRLIEKILDKSVPLDDMSIIHSLPKSFDALELQAVLLGRTETALEWPNPVREGVYPKEYPLSIPPDRRFDWGKQPYAENTKYLEYKTHLSPRGILCRSKSEAGILGIYDTIPGIPYHYDEVMYLNGRAVSPDIIGCRADGTFIFHEHLGRMDLEDYREHKEYKSRVYRSAGIIEGQNLLYTYEHEDGSINLKLIRDQITDIYRL